MPAIAYPHIVEDAAGRPRIEGTGLKALVLVARHIYAGYSAEELAEQFPPLTLAQAHALLAWYYDNKAHVDGLLRKREEESEALLERVSDPERLARLRAKVEARRAALQ